MRLTFAVTLICAVLGVAVAWCIERTDLPWRRFWAVVLVLPLAMPDFVLGYSWISIAPGVQGYWGSVLVMSLGSYPLVYLPVAAALRTADPSLEDVARGLGLGRIRTFIRVTLHQIRPALFGGSLLVALILLAEFGTFEILRFQTFTTQIYTEIQIGFSTTAGCALSLVLVLLGLLVLGAEAAGRGRAGAARRGQAGRRAARLRLGLWAVPVVGCLAGLLGLAIGVPFYALGYWFLEGTSSTLPPISIFSAAVSTALYSALAATGRDARRDPDRAARRAAPEPVHGDDGTLDLPRAGPAGHRGRPVARLLHDPVPAGALPVEHRARLRLRDHVLPARARRRARGCRPGAAGVWKRSRARSATAGSRC